METIIFLIILRCDLVFKNMFLQIVPNDCEHIFCYIFNQYVISEWTSFIPYAIWS